MNYQTNRLSIRPYQLDDYTSWLESFTARLPSRNRYDGGPIDKDRYPLTWFEKHIAKHQELAAKDDTYHFGVFDNKELIHYGHVEIHIVKRENYSWAWIGYYIHNQHQGNGYGPEAVRSVIKDIGFKELGLKRIEAIINTDNIASIRLTEKCGLHYECTKEKFIFEFGEWTDNHVYVILNESKLTNEKSGSQIN